MDQRALYRLLPAITILQKIYRYVTVYYADSEKILYLQVVSSISSSSYSFCSHINPCIAFGGLKIQN